MIQFIVYLLCLMSLVSNTVSSQPEFQKGMSFTSWSGDALLRSQSTESIRNMKKIGINWVALTVFWFQDNKNSTVITEDLSLYSASKPSLKKAIQDLHQAGIKVMLKPMVDLRTGEWRAAIVPSVEWFAAYENFLLNWAAFAVENQVEMLCIGCEFVDATQNRKFEPNWRSLIEHIRNVYPGLLTYADNHDNEQTTVWWDALDYIGIDAYYVLTSKNNPTAQELVTAWTNRANQIEKWRNRNWPQKPIIFTEIGYRSYDGANIEPWDYVKDDPNKVDLQEQVDCYNAALQVLTPRDWFYGFYWWQWDVNPSSGGLKDTGYTVQNKPAESLLQDWYMNRLVGGRFTTSGLWKFERYQ